MTEEQRREQAEDLAWRIAVASGVEYDKALAAVMSVLGPGTCRDVAAKPYVNHGDHGPEPRFEGDAWTVWYCCGNCDHPVSYGDAYCKTCGAELDWSK